MVLIPRILLAVDGAGYGFAQLQDGDLMLGVESVEGGEHLLCCAWWRRSHFVWLFRNDRDTKYRVQSVLTIDRFLLF